MLNDLCICLISLADFLQVIPLLECFYAYTIEGVNSRTVSLTTLEY